MTKPSREWRERDSLRAPRLATRTKSTATVTASDDRPAKASDLALDLREIRDPVHRVAEAREQREAARASAGVIGIDRDLVEERIDRRAQRSQRGHGGGEILGLDRRVAFGSAASSASTKRLLLRRNIVTPDLIRGPAAFFLLEDIRRPLVRGEQVPPLPRLDEPLQRLHPRQQPNKIVLPAKREHRVDEVMPNPGLALLDL